MITGQLRIPGLTPARAPRVRKDGTVSNPLVWKRARNVSKAAVTALRKSGKLAKARQLFLDVLEAHKNAEQEAPTLKELTRWAKKHGYIEVEDPNIFRPRATELGPGKVKRHKGGDISIIGGGVIEYLPARVCTVSKMPAHPIRVREAGSQESR